MSTSLSSLVDNLSEIYEKECKVCEERGKIKSVYKFISLENNKFNSIMNAKNVKKHG